MSYLAIPEPVKHLFNKFPLVTYPPVQQITSNEKLAIENRLYSFSASTSSQYEKINPHFKLGVYSVFQYNSKVYLATDPLCLSAELAISIRNGIKLPKINNEQSLKKNSLFVVSHHANSNGNLPMFIEEDEDNKLKFVKDYISIDEIYKSRVLNGSELVLISLIDNVVYDYWITSVLYEFSDETKSQIYQSDKISSNFVNSLGLKEVLNQLIVRNGFDLRNPNITKSWQQHVNISISGKLQQSVEIEKTRNLHEFKHVIKSLNSYLQEQGTRFFNKEAGDENKPGLLDVKLASYFLIGEKFAHNTLFHEVIKEHPLLELHSQNVLEYCV